VLEFGGETRLQRAELLSREGVYVYCTWWRGVSYGVGLVLMGRRGEE
jgi:hypothetical protein